MYNRQKHTISVLERSDTRDDYGYKSENFAVSRKIEAAVTLYSQNNTEDIRYKDATHLCLTEDKSLTDEMRIEDGGRVYDILLVNNESRLSQLFLKEVRKSGLS